MIPLPDAAAVWAHPDWSQVRWARECGRNHKTLARRLVRLGFRKTTRGRFLAGPCVACGWIREVADLDARHVCRAGCHGPLVRLEAPELARPVDPAVELYRKELAAFLLRPAGQRAKALEHALEVRDKMQGETMHLSGRAA